MSSEGCTCHISAPCPFCESLTEEEADILWSQGMEALRKYRDGKEDAIPAQDLLISSEPPQELPK